MALLLVDPNALAPKVLARLLPPDASVVMARSMAEAALLIATRHDIRAAAVADELPDGDALALLDAERERLDGIPRLVFSEEGDPWLINAVQTRGAMFAVKPLAGDNYRSLLARADEHPAMPLIRRYIAGRGLNRSEAVVLPVVLRARVRGAAAAELGISENTLKRYMRTILRKCDASTLGELARRILFPEDG